ncbi:MAG: hypothetical protein LBN38_06280 [Verrucomicrobiota bacterium]|nr:hypothetical protein [Verrucomicrobiota bacterium]
MRKVLLPLCLILVGGNGAIGSTPPSASEVVSRDVRDMEERLEELRQEVGDLQARLAEVENRLGPAFRPTSAFNTVEQRLDDLQNDVDHLKRNAR